MTKHSDSKTKVGFVFSNDPDPLLVERMRALEESGEFEAHAIFWHRAGSDLRFPFSPDPFSADRFTKVELPDPRAGALKRVWLTFRFSKFLRQWWKENQFDVLHIVYPNMLVAANFAMLGKKTPLVYDVWDVEPKPGVSSLKRFMTRTLLRKTPHVFSTSQAFIDSHLKTHDLLPSGIAATNVSNAPYSREALPKADRGERLVVGCLGNLRVQKQIRMLVDAVAEVRERGHDVMVRLSGAGSKKQFVETLTGDHSFVKYTGPYDYHRDAPSLYAELDLVYAVYPLDVYNYRVHIARRLHGAVLSQTPIIVSSDSANAEIVENEQIGWCVGYESLADLVRAITAACENRVLPRDIANNTKKVRDKRCFEGYR